MCSPEATSFRLFDIGSGAVAYGGSERDTYYIYYRSQIPPLRDYCYNHVGAFDPKFHVKQFSVASV